MELGIHALTSFDDAPLVRDLGVSWVKWGADVDADPLPDDRAKFEFWRNQGLRVIVDMRTSVAYMQQAAIASQQRLQKMGNWEVIPARHPVVEHVQAALAGAPADVCERVLAAIGNLPVDWETRQAIMLRNADRSMSECNRSIGDRAAQYVELHKELCQDYEFWGEYRCPYTGQGLFDRQAAYPAVMKQVFRQC